MHQTLKPEVWPLCMIANGFKECPQNDIVEQMDPGSVNNIGFVVIIARVNCSLLHNSLFCQMETI